MKAGIPYLLPVQVYITLSSMLPNMECRKSEDFPLTHGYRPYRGLKRFFKKNNSSHCLFFAGFRFFKNRKICISAKKFPKSFFLRIFLTVGRSISLFCSSAQVRSSIIKNSQKGVWGATRELFSLIDRRATGHKIRS